MLQRVVLVLVVAGVVAVATAAKRCPACDVKACAPINSGECLAGIMKDECNCCDVCGKLEGEPCDDSVRDPCGDGLECRRTVGPVKICQCKFEEILCGSDGKTYSNLCQLMAAAVREQVTDTLIVKSVGPCDPGARILSRPEYVRNRTNTDIVLQCEAIGMPSPSMAWIFTRADNQTYHLPGDDNLMVTSSRGGPGKFMVTSWLQIEGLQKYHEGDYTCLAFNHHNTDKATARVKVVDK